MGTKKIATADMGDGEWTDTQLEASSRWWRPEQHSPEHVACGRLGEAQASETKYGPKTFYILTATTAGEDSEGSWSVGQGLVIWESAGLKGLGKLVGAEVRITPNGRQGRQYTYRVQSRA